MQTSQSLLIVCLLALYVASVPVFSKQLTSQILTASNHDAQTQHGQWLVKYYAPWCKHCQHLAPVWDEVANELHAGTNINVAKFDCTTDKSICTKRGVKGYPTLMFLDGSTEIKHQGDRSKENLVKFAKRAAQEPVTVVTGDLSKVIADNDVSFVLTAGKGDPAFVKFEDVANDYRMDSLFYHVVSDKTVTITVYKDDTVLPYHGDVSNATAIDNWVRDNLFPAFVKFSSDMAIKLREVRPDCLIVVAVVDGEDEENTFLQKLKEISSAQPDSWDMQLAWMDGTGFWSGFIKHYWGIRGEDLPQLVAFNSVTRIYYSLDDTDWSDKSVGEIQSFLNDVADGKIDGRGGTGFLATLSTNFARLKDLAEHAWKSSWMEHEVAMTILGGTSIFLVGAIAMRYFYPTKPSEETKISVGKKD